MSALAEFYVLDEDGLQVLFRAARPERTWLGRRKRVATLGDDPSSWSAATRFDQALLTHSKPLGHAEVSGFLYGAVIPYIAERAPGFGRTFGYESERLSDWLDMTVQLFNVDDTRYLDQLPAEDRDPEHLSKLWEELTGGWVGPPVMAQALGDLETRIRELGPDELLLLRVS